MQLTTRTYLKNYSAAFFYSFTGTASWPFSILNYNYNYNWSSLVLPCRCTVGVYTPGIAIFAINTIKVVTLLPVRPCVCAREPPPLPPLPRVNTHTHSTRVSQHHLQFTELDRLLRKTKCTRILWTILVRNLS
jgi:hypothetical protein